MPAVKNISTAKANGNAVKSHENDPFILKQVAAAKEFLNRPGMQEQIKKLADEHKVKA